MALPSTSGTRTSFGEKLHNRSNVIPMFIYRWIPYAALHCFPLVLVRLQSYLGAFSMYLSSCLLSDFAGCQVPTTREQEMTQFVELGRVQVWVWVERVKNIGHPCDLQSNVDHSNLEIMCVGWYNPMDSSPDMYIVMVLLCLFKYNMSGYFQYLLAYLRAAVGQW